MKRKIAMFTLLIMAMLLPVVSYANINEALRIVPVWAKIVGYVDIENSFDLGLADEFINTPESTLFIDKLKEIDIDIREDLKYIVFCSEIPEELELFGDVDFIVGLRANYDVDKLTQKIITEAKNSVEYLQSYSQAPLFEAGLDENKSIFIALLPDFVIITSSKDLVDTVINLKAGRVSDITRNNAMQNSINSVSAASIGWLVMELPESIKESIRENAPEINMRDQDPSPNNQPNFQGINIYDLIKNIYSIHFTFSLQTGRNDRYELKLGFNTTSPADATKLSQTLESLYLLFIRPYMLNDPEWAPYANEISISTAGSSSIIRYRHPRQ